MNGSNHHLVSKSKRECGSLVHWFRIRSFSSSSIHQGLEFHQCFRYLWSMVRGVVSVRQEISLRDMHCVDKRSPRLVVFCTEGDGSRDGVLNQRVPVEETQFAVNYLCLQCINSQIPLQQQVCAINTVHLRDIYPRRQFLKVNKADVSQWHQYIPTQ